MRWLPSLALTFTMVAGYGRTARAAEPEVAPLIEIAIDVADLPDTRAELATVVEAELNRLLIAHEALPAGVILASDRRLLVEIRPSPIPGTDDVLIHVEVQLEGKTLGESATETCLSCTDEQVAEKALLLLEPSLSDLPAPAPVAPPAPTVANVDEEPDENPTPSDRVLLISSCVVLGVGVVGVGVGIGLIAADERVVSPPDALDFEVIKYREVGIATTVIGGAAVVTGAVLLGVVLKRRGRSQVVAAPALGPRQWGISLVGQF